LPRLESHRRRECRNRFFCPAGPNRSAGPRRTISMAERHDETRDKAGTAGSAKPLIRARSPPRVEAGRSGLASAVGQFGAEPRGWRFRDDPGRAAERRRARARSSTFEATGRNFSGDQNHRLRPAPAVTARLLLQHVDQVVPGQETPGRSARRRPAPSTRIAGHQRPKNRGNRGGAAAAVAGFRGGPVASVGVPVTLSKPLSSPVRLRTAPMRVGVVPSPSRHGAPPGPVET